MFYILAIIVLALQLFGMILLATLICKYYVTVMHKLNILSCTIPLYSVYNTSKVIDLDQ